MILATLAAALAVQQANPQWRKAIEQGFQDMADAGVRAGRTAADAFVDDLNRDPSRRNIWPALADTNVPSSACAEAFSEPVSIDPHAFLNRVGERERWTESQSAQVAKECQIYSEGPRDGQNWLSR